MKRRADSSLTDFENNSLNSFKAFIMFGKLMFPRYDIFSINMYKKCY